MSNTYLSFHGCSGLRVQTVMPDNGNSITLEIAHELTEQGYPRNTSQITLYDLPAHEDRHRQSRHRLHHGMAGMSAIIPSREELVAEVDAEIHNLAEAEWLVDHVLLPAFGGMLRQT